MTMGHPMLSYLINITNYNFLEFLPLVLYLCYEHVKIPHTLFNFPIMVNLLAYNNLTSVNSKNTKP